MRRIAASQAKNNFGGLLEQVAEHGRVEITKHGRVVAVVIAPRLVGSLDPEPKPASTPWEPTHMIPPRRARAARMLRPPEGFDG